MEMPEKIRLSIDLINYLKTEAVGGKPARVEDLAAKIGTTKNFLHQIVAKLSKAGMVSVIKGPHGGVLCSLTDHSLLDVYQLFGYLEKEKLATSASSKVQNQIIEFLDDIVV